MIFRSDVEKIAALSQLNKTVLFYYQHTHNNNNISFWKRNDFSLNETY